MKFKTTIAIIYFVTILIGSLFGMYFNYLNANEILTEQVYNHLETIARSRAQHIEHFFEEQRDKIQTAATHQEFTNEELKEIRDINKEFYELFVLNFNGKVIASSDESYIGLDRSTDDYFIHGKNKTYIMDAYYSEIAKQRFITVSTPYLEGVLVAKIKLIILENITKDKIGLGETGETYLINKDRFLITSSKFFLNNIMVQEVNTKNADLCMEHFKENVKEHIGHEPIGTYLDYRGEKVLGTHVYIPEMQWCLIAEVDEAKVLGEVKERLFKHSIIFLITLVVLITLIGFFIGGWFERVYLIRKLKESKFIRLLSKIKLKYFLIFALIFAIGCFFLITSFFQGWQNAAFYDDIPDLLALMAFVFLLFFSFHLKNIHAKKFIFIGALFSIIDRISQIILEEYIFAFGLISEIYWIPGAILGFIGLIIIFLGFAEVVK